MADNPYHKWLGLDSKIKNPHHFQLLGVSSKVAEPDSYRKQVLAAAQAKLEMLDRVEGAENKQLVQKLKQRINTARDVLCDPQKRASYVTKLKAQIAASKSAKPPESAASPAGGSKPTAPRPKAPTAKLPSNLPPSSKETKNVAPGTRSPGTTQAASSTPPIPMAIPLNQSGQPSATESFPIPGAQASTAKSSAEEVIDPEDIDLSKLKFQKVSRKKRSKAVPIILSLITLAALAGAYWLYASSDKFELVLRPAQKEENSDAEITPKKSAATSSMTNEKNPTEENSVAETAPTLELTAIDIDSLPTLDVDEVMEHPDTLSATNRNLKRQKEKAAKTQQRLAEASEKDLDPSIDTSKSPTKTKPSSRADNHSNKPTRQLDPDQLAEYRTRMQRLRQSLFRRDSTTADLEMKQLEEMFGGLLGNEFAIDPQQRGLKDLFDATSQSKELLDGFWEQTVKSCRSIPGGQEIKVGEQILGFVEADDRQVILRNAGSNVVYEYEHLPPGLAVVLANQGAIPDIPTWRMQQAAFYSLYADQNPKYEDQVEQFVDLAESDGHDGFGLRRFLNPKLDSIGVPTGRVDLPDRQQLVDSIADFRSEHKYSDPAKLKPARADELANLLIDKHPENVDQRLANLVEARKLGIHAGNAYLVEDAIQGLDVWANFNKPDMLANAFHGLSKQKLDSAQARRLMETAIPFLKSPDAKTADPQKIKQLKKRVTKIAEENEFVDSMRRLNQLK